MIVVVNLIPYRWTYVIVFDLSEKLRVDHNRPISRTLRVAAVINLAYLMT